MTKVLLNHAYVMKPPYKSYGAQRTSELVNTWRYWEGGAPGEDREALLPFPTHYLVHFLHLAVPELYPFIINWLYSK